MSRPAQSERTHGDQLLMPVLPVNRLALLRALKAGASTEELARASGWAVPRVKRELAAVRAQLEAVSAGPAGDQPVPDAPATGGPGGDGSATEGPRSDRAARARPKERERDAADGHPSDTPLPERPRVAKAVEIGPPPPAGEHRVVHDPRSGRYLRVKLAQATFLERLNGSRTVAELATTPNLIPGQMVVPLLTRFAALGLLEGTEPPARTKPAGKFVVKLVTFDPERALTRATPALRWLTQPVALIASALLAVSGVVAVAAHTPATLLNSPYLRQPLFVLSAVVAVVATTMLHELGHAAAVTVLGGRVRRMGLMSFYLLPAMFCDTTDAWRFPYRWQRIVVAMSGIGVQLTVTGVIAQVLWFAPGTGVRTWVVVYACANIGMSAYNLVPLVKLDGYWALAAAVDRPNLRSDALARAAKGARGPGLGLALYGAACAVFGPLLVLYALLRWEHLLLGVGWIGALAWYIMLMVVAAPATRAAARAPRLPLGAALVVAVAALVLVPVAHGHGQVSLGRLLWQDNLLPPLRALGLK